jgi:hypothetical protein
LIQILTHTKIYSLKICTNVIGQSSKFFVTQKNQFFYREEFLALTSEIEKIIDKPYEENILGKVGD